MTYRQMSDTFGGISKNRKSTYRQRGSMALTENNRWRRYWVES